MSHGVRAIVVLCVTMIGLMLVLFAVATREMGLVAGLRAVAGTWWGITTLADLGVGLLFVCAWVCVTERRAWARPVWVLAILLLGNFTTLVYILLRCRGAACVRDVFLRA